MKKTTTLIAAALFGCTFVTNAQDGKKEDTRFASPEKKRSYAIGMFFGTRAKSTQKDGDEFDRDALIEGLRDVLEGKKNLDYASGVGIGQTLKRDNMVVDVETLSQALKDVFSEGGKTKLTEEESRAEISMLQQELQEKRAEEREMEKKKWEKQMAEAAPKNEASGKAFLAENGKKEGVKTTGSGLQYKILKEGEGKTPGEKDRVSVIYKGMLLDGTVFDDSQGKPRSFGVNRVIKGWTEGLQLMKEGGKATLWIPGDIAYGMTPRMGGKIEAMHTLVFDVELVGVKEAPVVPKTSATSPAKRKPITAVTPPVSIEIPQKKEMKDKAKEKAVEAVKEKK